MIGTSPETPALNEVVAVSRWDLISRTLDRRLPLSVPQIGMFSTKTTHRAHQAPTDADAVEPIYPIANVRITHVVPPRDQSARSNRECEDRFRFAEGLRAPIHISIKPENGGQLLLD
jgi:hypothetical protein